MSACVARWIIVSGHFNKVPQNLVTHLDSVLSLFLMGFAKTSTCVASMPPLCLFGVHTAGRHSCFYYLLLALYNGITGEGPQFLEVLSDLFELTSLQGIFCGIILD